MALDNIADYVYSCTFDPSADNNVSGACRCAGGFIADNV